MCNWSSEFKKFSGDGIYGKFNNSEAAQVAMRNVGIPWAQPGVCPGCGKPLSHEEMHPRGAQPRHYCSLCYENFFNRLHSSCVVCGAQLPFNKVQQQHGNWREAEFHICDEQVSPGCKATYALLHAIVLGLHPPLGQPQVQRQTPQEPFPNMQWQQPQGGPRQVTVEVQRSPQQSVGGRQAQGLPPGDGMFVQIPHEREKDRKR